MIVTFTAQVSGEPGPGHNGQPLQAVSFASKEGETVRYTAVDGVIETSDAEHAAVMVGMQLEPANDSAQKIVGPADQPSTD